MAARWILGLTWLTAALLPAADDMPLAESGPAHAAVVHALTRLTQGDLSALEALPDSVFSDPPALKEPTRPGTAWRWTLLIPWARVAGQAGLPAVHARLVARAAHLSPGLERDLGAMAADATSVIVSPGTPHLPGPYPDPLSGPPGLPQLAPNAAESDPASAMRRSGQHLVCTDDAGLVTWQLLLEPNAQVWPSSDAAVVAESRGWRWLDHSGASHALPPMPAEVTTLGVDGGAAFFAKGSRGWRLGLTGKAGAAFSAERPQSLELDGEPLGAPLAGDGACLWLTMRSVVWWTGGAVVTLAHGLPAGRGWHLARGGAGVALILAPDGQAWAMSARKPGENPPGDIFRAALVRGDWVAARGLASDAAALAALAFYAGEAVPSGASDLLPRNPAELGLPASAWSGSVAAWARPAVVPALPASYDRSRPLMDASEPYPAAVEVRRTQEGLVLGQRNWQVSDNGERAEATCHEDGRLRWNARWLPEPGLAAPARSVALTDGYLLIGEGDSRLMAFAADTGLPALDVRPRRLPVLPGRTWLRSGHAGAVVLFPPGLDDQLGWFDADGSERVDKLATSARWLLCLGDATIWLALVDGSARTLSDGVWKPLILPPELIASPDQPRLVEGGVAAGARLWRWASRR